MPDLGDWMNDISNDSTAVAAEEAAVTMVELLALVDGEQWDDGRGYDFRWDAADERWTLIMGDRRCTLDLEGRLHDRGRDRLRVIDAEGEIVFDLNFGRAA